MVAVAGLYKYLVKGCKGTELIQSNVGSYGLAHDRKFMVVDKENGMFVAQRQDHGLGIEIKILCQIAPELKERFLILDVPGMPSIEVSLNGGRRRQVQVWKAICEGVDMGDAVASWLDDFLGRERPGEYRLVQRPHDFDRKSKGSGARISYADAFPFLVISQASLDDLNRRIQQNGGGEPLPMNRFRPNIVLGDCEAYAEDHMRIICIDDVVLRGGTLCVRCPVTMTDQDTAERGKEPLRTLATYRRNPLGRGVIFGRNFDHTTLGAIQVGQEVRVLEVD